MAKNTTAPKATMGSCRATNMFINFRGGYGYQLRIVCQSYKSKAHV